MKIVSLNRVKPGTADAKCPLCGPQPMTLATIRDTIRYLSAEATELGQRDLAHILAVADLIAAEAIANQAGIDD